MAAAVSVLVGTSKGVFILRNDGDRANWTHSGPHCDLWPINHVKGDPATGTLWAAGGGKWEGAGVWRSDDDGATWTVSLFANGEREAFVRDHPEMAAQWGMEPAPARPLDGKVDTIWSICPAGDRLYAGARPGALYVSEDRGTTWAPVDGLNRHPSADSWEPGGAGLTLHTILADAGDPRRIWVGISAAGVFATEDGGATWERRNRRSNAPTGPQEHAHDASEVGHCVHNMVRAGAAPGDLLYMQNHHGVFRSQDGGRAWDEVSAGLPSTFGFPIAVHPQDPQTIWVIPMNGDSIGRYPPDASAAVWRSRDGGQNWSAQRQGLPDRNCYFTVLRQAMATDGQSPAGIYFGTNSGSVFASADEGETWTEIARHLPTVLSVETLERS